MNPFSCSLRAVTVFSILASTQAFAHPPQVGADYAEGSGERTIVTEASGRIGDPADPLVSVTIVCPEKGFTIAHGEANFRLVFDGSSNKGDLAFGINRNVPLSTDGLFTTWDRPLDAHRIVLAPPADLQFEQVVGDFLRSDTCEAGEEVVYRLIASRVGEGLVPGPGAFVTSALKPKLSVVWYRELEPEVVNDLVSFTPDPSTYQTTSDVTGCPSGYVGKFSFESTLTNISSSTLTNLQVNVAKLNRRNQLLTDAGLIGEGESFTVTEAGGDYSDGVLSPGEFVDVPFTVCLKEIRPFTLLVDVLGVESESGD